VKPEFTRATIVARKDRVTEDLAVERGGSGVIQYVIL